jgi:hypothetical protein
MIDTLIAKKEAVRSFTLDRLRREHVTEIHVQVKRKASALMRLHRYV